MPLKSTQTNKYETACYVQEAPVSSEMDPRGFKVFVSSDGHHYCTFDSTLQTFNCANRMGRQYDPQNLVSVIDNDERIQTLLRQNKWRGELNHPNPDIKGQQYSDIRMTIPEPMRTSHFIRKPRLVGDRYKGIITTHPGTECGRAASSEIIDIGAVPSFSVRLLGNMIPNAPQGRPNMKVTKVITYDMVDFPSHRDADGDIRPMVHQEGTVLFLSQLAKYCVDQSENLQVVCESFEITPDELTSVHNGNLEINTNDGARIRIPLENEIRREAMNILMKRGI
jgi:hypothetical protein